MKDTESTHRAVDSPTPSNTSAVRAEFNHLDGLAVHKTERRISQRLTAVVYIFEDHNGKTCWASESCSKIVLSSWYTKSVSREARLPVLQVLETKL